MNVGGSFVPEKTIMKATCLNTNQPACLTFSNHLEHKNSSNKHIFSNQRSEIASQNNDPGHPSQEQRRFDSVLWKTSRANSMPR